MLATEDMEPVAELAVLDVADEGVDPRDRLGIRARRVEAEHPVEPERARLVADVAAQPRTSRRIEPVGVGEFVEQNLEPPEPCAAPAALERRGDMPDRHRADAALGLCRFAWIVDDERVDHGQRAGQRLGPAGVRQRDRLARQPFERAVRADMDQRVRAPRLQPEVEGDVPVTRAARQVMIFFRARGGTPAFGLQRDDALAAGIGGKTKLAFADGRVALRLAPRGEEIVAQRRR